jgi:hypothetical protein
MKSRFTTTFSTVIVSSMGPRSDVNLLFICYHLAHFDYNNRYPKKNTKKTINKTASKFCIKEIEINKNLDITTAHGAKQTELVCRIKK